MDIIFEISTRNYFISDTFRQKNNFFEKNRCGPPQQFSLRCFSRGPLGVNFSLDSFLLKSVRCKVVSCADFEYDIHFAQKFKLDGDLV